MDDNIDYVEYQPGHWHLRLKINKFDDVIDDVTLAGGLRDEDDTNSSILQSNTRLRDLKCRYDNLLSSIREDDVPDPVAAGNLLGLLAARLDDLELAISHFETVLEEDGDNVNAIQNIAQSYARMNKQELAEKWSAKVQRLLGRTDQSVAEKLVNKRIACSLAEQAYAHAYDIGLVHYEARKQRLETAIRMFDRAFNIGGSVISLWERRRWYFVMATIFVRLDTLMMWSRELEKARLPGFNRAVNLLKEVAKSDLLYHEVLAWAYLGILIERQSNFETTPMSIHDCGFTGVEPLDNYSKAIKLAEKQAAILCRLAKVFLLLGKQELAIGTASMAVEMSSDDVTLSSAYHCRARVNTSTYMRDLALCKLGSSTMPDRSLLEKAKEDLDHVVSTSPSLCVYMDIGQVCYYMGVDAIKESFLVNEDYVNKALVYFAKSLECEVGATLPELQLLRGKCLRVKGEERNALECFKRAVEMDRNGSKNPQAFRCLMETLVIWYWQGGSVKRDAIINDVDSWIRMALNKYDNDVIIAELRSISHNYTNEILELCKGTIRAGKMTLAKIYFSVFPPSIPDENTDTESAN